MLRKFYIFLLVGMISSGVYAQDIHFSQYGAAPLTLNPALTANINGMFRVAVNYRNQWFTIPVLNASGVFQTYQASFDMPILRERLNNDNFGFGATFYNDRAGDGALSTNTGMVSIAYQKAVDRYGRAHIGLGIQAGITAKQIKIDNLIFENQFDGVNWNPSLSNGEGNFSNKAILNPNVNLGLLWTHAPGELIRYYVGYGLFNIAKPKESFLNDDRNRLNHRHIVHGGADFYTDDELRFSISPTFLFMLQSNAQQYNFGLGLNYAVSDNVEVFGGLGFRTSKNPDAAIFRVGAEAFGARLGISYDINVSGLRTASKAQGAVELSLIYIFKKEKPAGIQYEKYCPNC